MSDTSTPTPAPTPAPIPANPFNDNDWTPPSDGTPPVNNDTPPAPAPPAPAPVADPPAPAPKAEESDILDADVYIKEQLGFDTLDAAKAAIAEWNDLREKAKTPAEYKYANDQSKKIAEAINAGDDESIWRYLDQKRKITNGKSLDAANKAHAADIIKLSMQLQNPDLSSEDVDYKFRKQFGVPKKPVQTVEQDDDEYAQIVSDWEERVRDIERDMIIEAKMAKPKLAEYELKVVLPDIPKTENANPAPAPPTPEELAAQQADRQRYLTATEAGIKNFKEIKTLVKDEEVEIPVAYLISDEERAKAKTVVESLYGGFDYFLDRWKNQDGSLNETKLVEDILLLENSQKMFQKIANESAAKRMAHKITASKNPAILPNGSNGKPAMQVVDNDAAMADFWKNS